MRDKEKKQELLGGLVDGSSELTRRRGVAALGRIRPGSKYRDRRQTGLSNLWPRARHETV